MRLEPLTVYPQNPVKHTPERATLQVIERNKVMNDERPVDSTGE
jgi:hypothetical protein